MRINLLFFFQISFSILFRTFITGYLNPPNSYNFRQSRYYYHSKLSAYSLFDKTDIPIFVQKFQESFNITKIYDFSSKTPYAFYRTGEIWSLLLKYSIEFLKLQNFRQKDSTIYLNKLQNVSMELTNSLIHLGPTFIKLGQILSTRNDIFPKEFTDPLSQLQDKVPSFSSEEVNRVFMREFGKPANELYDSFNMTPFSAASLGQVHLASLNNKLLAVKVQRPDLRRMFDVDFRNIYFIAQILDNIFSPNPNDVNKFTPFVNEAKNIMYKEIDYTQEAQNSLRFKENFKDTPWVKVPEVLSNLTSQSILSMEYVPGVKINDRVGIEKAGVDCKVIARRCAESYLTQLCRHGFFHCDPHPGNLACDAEAGGRLIYYDFGMMSELSQSVKTGFTDLVFSFYENDAKGVCKALETIEALNPGSDKQSIERITRYFLRDFQQGIQPEGKRIYELPLERQFEVHKLRQKQFGKELLSIQKDGLLKFPPNFSFVIRAFGVLDGVGKMLDSKYDLFRLAQPYLKELVDLRDGSFFLSIVKSFIKTWGFQPKDFYNYFQQSKKIANIDQILTQIEQGELLIRVRDLENERTLSRLELLQQNLFVSFLALSLFNSGILISIFGVPNFSKLPFMAKIFFACSSALGILWFSTFRKIKELIKPS